MLREAARREFRDCCLFAGVTWKASALRIAAERESADSNRRLAIKKAWKAVRAALKLTKSYRACRPFALREAGILATMEQREDMARRYFEQSLQLAEQHEALYDRAKTLLAQGEAGLKFGWSGAAEQIEIAQKQVADIENVESD